MNHHDPNIELRPLFELIVAHATFYNSGYKGYIGQISFN